MGGRKKIISLLILMVFLGNYSQVKSQDNDGWFNYSGYNWFSFSEPERSVFNFALLFQYNQPWYHIVKSNSFVATDTFWSVTPLNGTGFSMGIMMEWNINKYLQLSTNLAQLVLDYRTVEYRLKFPGFRENTVESKLLETPYLQWPFTLKLRSDKIADKFRVYMFAGGFFNLDIGKKNAQSIRTLLITGSDWGINCGVGFHLYFPTITVSPQFIFSAGTNNLLQMEPRSKFNNSIQELYNRSLSFSIIISP